jgi:hypothetical protein
VHGEEGDLLSTSFTRRTIVDHCSFTGGMDEEIENIWSADYTMQWCTVEESAKFGQGGAQHKEGDHNYGFLSGYNAEQGISVHHTLFAHHGQRTPWCKLGPAEVRNTVVYDGDGVHLGAPAKGEEFNPAGGAFNLVGNYYRAAAVGRRELILWVIQAGDKGASVYFRDNFLDRDKDQRSVDDPTIKVPAAFSRFEAGVAVLKEPIAVPFLGKIHTSKEAYDVVLAQAGAWPRDATTRRTVKEVRERTGQFGLRGPYEQFAAREDGPTSAKFDTDRDGMPDAWEIAHGLNPNDPTDGNKIVPKGASKDDRHAGYAYVEHYLNELADSLVGIDGPLCEVTVEADGKGQIAAVHGGRTTKWNSRQPPKEVDWGTVQVFNEGSTVGLKAVPDEGDAFDHWSGGSVDGSKEPIVWLHVEANTKVVAHFAAKVK